jgi:hypothetical protein
MPFELGTEIFRRIVAHPEGVEIARQRMDWQGNNHALLIARGTFGTLALFTFFLTLQRMPLATAESICPPPGWLEILRKT